MDLLKQEGTTWAELVKKSVEEKSLKEIPPPEPVKPEEVTVSQLVKEAEELKKLLDGFGESFGVVDEADPTPATSPA